MNMKQFIPAFRRLGWVYSADSMGEYFRRGNRCISAMHVGPTFTCYVNDLLGGTRRLVASMPNLITPAQAAQWMMTYAR